MSNMRFWRPSRPAPPATGCARRTIAVGVGIGYACAVLGHALARPLLGEREGWVELIDDLEPWAYLPAPAIGIAGALLGSGGLVAAGAALAASFGLRWGHRYLGRPAADEARRTASDLTIMTFNTLAWQREGRDLEASIARADPDIVALQEIGPRGARHLVNVFGERYPHHYVTEAASSSGAAVLSRYPLRDTAALQASPHGHWWQRMMIDTPCGSITYVNVHTRIPYIRKSHRKIGGLRLPVQFHAGRRRHEVHALATMLETVDGPAIVVGDFNMTERSADYQVMARRLRDAYRAVGRGLGHSFPRWGAVPRAFPAPFPLLRLDYVWHSEHFAPSWAYLGDAGHSDHHPVVVGLRWSAPATSAMGGVPLAASAV